MEIYSDGFASLNPPNSTNISLTTFLFNSKTPYDFIINPVFNVARSNLSYGQNQELQFWYQQKITWGLNPYEELIFRVLVNEPYGLFKKGFIYYFRNFAIYETLQNAIDEVDEIVITNEQIPNVSIGTPNKTYRPQRYKLYANADHINFSPEPYAFDYGPFPDTCTIVTGGYTIICKWFPDAVNETTFSGSFDYSYTYTDENDDVITTVELVGVSVLIAVPTNLGETGGATDTVVTIEIVSNNGALVSKTITEPHADFPLTDTVAPTITSGLNEFDAYFLDLDEITYTFSGEIIFPQEIRVNLPNAYFTGEGGDVLDENIDEILTLDLETGCYVSDIKNYYNIPGRLIIETAIWGPSGTGFKFFIGPIDYHGYSIYRLNVGKRFYDNIYYDWFPQIKENENNIQNKYTAVISTGSTDINSETNSFTDFGYHINSTAVEKNGYIAPRFKYYVDSLDEDGTEYLVGQGTRTFNYDWSGGIHNVSYAIFTSCRKVYGELYDYENTPYNYYPPWHPSQNFFKNPRFFLASDSVDAFISSVRIGAAPNAPTITFNDDAIEEDAESFTIAGTDFNLEPADNLVTFNLGAVGKVTAATITELTVTFTTQPTSLGNLEVTLLMPLSSGTAVQVATVVAAITVTPNSDYLAINAPTLVIAGTGFSATANHNTVTFNLGAVGTVTSATTTELTITFSTQPTADGSLTAVVAVSTSNGDSGSPVQVANVYYSTLRVTSDNGNIDYVQISNSIYNGKKFWIAGSYDGSTLSYTTSIIYWTGSEWLIAGQYGIQGNDYATNSSDTEIPPVSGWVSLSPYTTTTVSYQSLNLPNNLVNDYACVTGNAIGSQTFNGQYFRLQNQSTNTYHNILCSQRIVNAYNWSTFIQNNNDYYQKSGATVNGYYDRLTDQSQPPGVWDSQDNNDGIPAPEVALGEC